MWTLVKITLGRLPVWLVATTFILASCVPIQQEVVVVPQTTGSVWDAHTGDAVSQVTLRARTENDEFYPSPPLTSDTPGQFSIPLWEEERTTWRLPTVGGSYRSGYVLEVSHADFMNGYMLIAFIHPFQRQTDGYPVLMYREYTPLPDLLEACTLRPATRHAWTLASDLNRLAREDWFNALFISFGAEIYMIEEYLDSELNHFYRSCGISGEEQLAIQRTYRSAIELLIQNEAYLRTPNARRQGF
ncbi:hypothetical protein [Aliidiomarina sanyensis]|uniref:Uncharacterized protein n=1 Tax=Aliidiomarina sanyensis TaxID=1249555 RepID=A0A432WRB5_9GAMM|nr:hypothetical protein [Aliidiomarina sanyensis]RUO36269.1 hypothetical protein CWE11_00155 [Aliidiomarina sanyensis]